MALEKKQAATLHEDKNGSLSYERGKFSFLEMGK